MPTIKKVEITTTVNVEIPDGYEFVEYRLPKQGEQYVLMFAGHFQKILTASWNYTSDKQFIVKKIEPKQVIFTEEPEFIVSMSRHQLEFLFCCVSNLGLDYQRQAVTESKERNQGLTLSDGQQEVLNLTDEMYPTLKEMFK